MHNSERFSLFAVSSVKRILNKSTALSPLFSYKGLFYGVFIQECLKVPTFMAFKQVTFATDLP